MVIHRHSGGDTGKNRMLLHDVLMCFALTRMFGDLIGSDSGGDGLQFSMFDRLHILVGLSRSGNRKGQRTSENETYEKSGAEFHGSKQADADRFG